MKLASLKRPTRDLVYGVAADGFRLGLSIVYAPWLVDILRNAGGAWHAQSRMWVFPKEAVNGALAAKIAQEAPVGSVFDVDQTVARILSAQRDPDPELFAAGLDVQFFPTESGDSSVVQYKKDALLERTITALGGKQLRDRSGWFLGLPVQAALDALVSQAGVLRESVYISETAIVLAEGGSTSVSSGRPTLKVGGAVNESSSDGIERVDGVLSVLMTPIVKTPVAPEVIAKAIVDFGLYDYQGVGVAHLLSASGSLLADDMGLGKTLQLITAAALSGSPGVVVVVCPVSLCVNWEREIHRVLPNADVAIIGSDPEWTGAEWIITSYERQGSILSALNQNLFAIRAVAFDEAHNLKEITAARTRNAFLIAKHAARRMVTTATPILNAEAEIHTLLRLSGHPIGELPLSEFRKEFAGSGDARRALKARIAEWMLRRPKSVVKGLKGKSHQKQFLSLTPESRREYALILSDDSVSPLVKVGMLRQLLERFKRTWAVETVQALADGDKVIIACEHVAVIPLLAAEFAGAGIPAVTFSKLDTPKRRQAHLDEFQSNPEIRVIIVSRRLAGVGLTVTAANYVMSLSLPWNAAQQRQLEDRAYRNGQTRHVSVLIPIVTGTIDERLLDIHRYKENIERDILDEGTTGVVDVEADDDATSAVADLLLA